jgi:RHS repeat-associated protein
MKNLKFFSFVLILYGLLFLAFSLNGNMRKEENNYLSQDSIPIPTIPVDTIPIDTVPKDTSSVDTNQTDNPPIESQDVSSMFNERGYLKSNSASVDESEIINDFNGNLQYSIPLFNSKEKGDLSIDLKLNYNNSINYQVFASTQEHSSAGILYKYNVNAPGWIISLNGMAVQMMNFETRYLTNEMNESYVVPNENVRLLANGYHITDNLSGVTQANSEAIYIMRGDGSVITLRRYDGPSGLENYYIGHFYSEGKNEYFRGEVSFIDDNSNPALRKRKLSLMGGDGLTYVYEEKNFDYCDIDSNTTAFIRPQGFLLTKLADRFGNTIYIDYTNVYNPSEDIKKGRPCVSNIYTSWNQENFVTFLYSSSLKYVRIIQNSYSYYLYCDKINLDNSGDHRSNVVKIKNPKNDEINISYLELLNNPNSLNYYERNEYNLYNPITSQIGYPFERHFDMRVEMKFSRISSFTNYNGGIRKYKYKTYNGTNNMDLNMIDLSPIKNMSTDKNGNYFGHGRDLFFSNMLLSKETYDGTNIIKTDSFDYHYWTDRTTSWNVETVNPSDSLLTTRTVTNYDTQTINETPSTIIAKKEYKLYPILPRYWVSGMNRRDFAGFTKLVKEDYKTGVSNPVFRTVTYSFDSSSKIFLDTNITENINGVIKRKSFRYLISSGPLTDNNYIMDNPISKKTEYDNFWRNIETQYFVFYDTSLFFNINVPSYGIVKIYYYTIYQPLNIKIFSPSNSLLYREGMEYLLFNDTINKRGYMGQLIFDTIYNVNNTNEFNITRNIYNIRDTTGRYIYGWDLPLHEGCLKSSINSMGDTTFYYNFPLTNEYSLQNLDGLPGSDTVYSGDNITSLPGIKYIKAYDDNTEEILNENWYDQRMPIITKYKIKDNYYLSTFKRYYGNGQLKWEITPNKYLTEFTYDSLTRISKATAPYDFNNTSSYVPTLRYEYDDINNTSDVYSKMYSSVTKRNQYLFDGFYRVKESRLYDAYNNYTTTSTIKYNYLDLKAYSKDGENNETKYSYDEHINLKKTLNADNSYTLMSSTYQNGISGYAFGGQFSGFINKQVFTDEVGNNFEKYYDAVGNLRREVKFLSEIPSEGSGDSTGGDGGDNVIVSLITDFNYDAMYRLTVVKTPQGKYINYEYDGFGRQTKRTTPDAGDVLYKYDRKNNLRFSQDENQRHRTTPANSFAFKGYDGIDRLIYSGDTYENTTLPIWNNLNPDIANSFEDYSVCPTNFLLVNVYDTLSNAIANNIFVNPPYDYYYEYNRTKGKVVATAYRTLGTDNWSFKYYRYDGRGRVIKMWNVIEGLGTKKFKYTYNSQNQATVEEYQTASYDNDYMKYFNYFDFAGRLESVKADQYGNPNSLDFTNYEYNGNSQVDYNSLNNGMYYTNYSYDSRNRVTEANNGNEIFNYNLNYYANGNVHEQSFSGLYNGNARAEIGLHYIYDQSNRLVLTTSLPEKLYITESTSYDHDGNINTLSRSYNNDNFTYDYFSGTNRIKKVSGTVDFPFDYDYNGNLITDSLNKVIEIKYDYRNLITELKYNTDDTLYYHKLIYKYDESGNRIRKRFVRQMKPLAIPDTNNTDATSFDSLSDGNGVWFVIKDEFYVRDASGKEIAVYDRGNLEYWNVWGRDLEGKIKAEGSRYFYLKDHLGSIRAVLDESGNIFEARDYDPWGHIIREIDNSDNDPTRNKFTGKERDWESGYDYFGARYYNSRIANWTSIDLLLEKHFDWSPYNYVLRNPMVLLDPDGKQIYFSEDQDRRYEELANMKHMFNPEYKQFFEIKETNDQRYILNSDRLSESGIQNNELFDAILSIASGNDPVSYNNLLGTETFHALDNDEKRTDRSYTLNGLGLYGLTLVSGNDNFKGEQKPKAISLNDETRILINSSMDQTQQCISLAHEFAHTDNYLNGHIWAYEKINYLLLAKIKKFENLALIGNNNWGKKAKKN